MPQKKFTRVTLLLLTVGVLSLNPVAQADTSATQETKAQSQNQPGASAPAAKSFSAHPAIRLGSMAESNESDSSVDCFYEANASHPTCQKSAPVRRGAADQP